jgi:putative MATE family efflux protein
MSFSTKTKKVCRLFVQALKGEEQDYTSGSIDRAIFLLSIPMIVEMSLEGVFAIVDIFYVSRLADNSAVATVGLTESMLMIIYSLAMGLSMGATALVARRVGEKNIPDARVAAGQAVLIGIFLSLLISVVGIFFSEDLLRLMGASPAIIEKNIGYTHWMLIGNMTIILLFLINGIFRGAGDASLAMRSLLMANALNIALGPIFIFGLGPIPGFGIEGAAIATNIGRGSAVIYQIYMLLKGKGLIRIDLSGLRARWNIIGNLLSVSAGGTGQFLIGSASWIFLVRLMSDFGEAPLAGYVFAVRFIGFAILPAWGMANAAATLVGQNLGAQQPDRAEKSAWRAAFLNMIFLGLVTIIFFTMAHEIIGVFSTDPVVLRNGVLCLQVVSLGYVFYGYGMVITQAFNGAGDTRTPIVISFFGFWLFQIPFAYLLARAFDTGPVGVYAAISTAESLMAVAAILIFRRGKWKTIKI